MNHLQDTEPPFKMERSLYFNMGLMLVGAVALLAFNGPYLRLEHERKQEKYEAVPPEDEKVTGTSPAAESSPII
jgi:hypothetical protein